MVDPKQNEIPMNMERDLPFTMQTLHSSRVRSGRRCYLYRDDFVVDRTDQEKIAEEIVGLEEVAASKEVDTADDQDNDWSRSQRWRSKL